MVELWAPVTADAQMLVGFGPSERARWLDYWKRVAPGT